MKAQKHKFLTFCFILCVLILSSFGAFGLSSSDNTRIPKEWAEHGYETYNPSGHIDLITNNVGLNTTEDFDFEANLTIGNEVQPLVYDWDGDGYLETILVDNSQIATYELQGNSFALESTYSTTGQVAVTGWCGDFGYNDDDVCVFADGSFFYVFTNNNGVITENRTFSAPDPVSSINCIEDASAGFGNPFCFYNDADNKLTMVNVENESYVQYSSGRLIDSGDKAYKKHKPIIADYDYDGDVEIIFTSIDTGSTNLDHDIYIINKTTNALTFEQNIEVQGGGTTSDFTGVVAYDFDGTTDMEICALYDNGANEAFRCYNSDGSLYASKSVYTTAYHCDGLILTDMDGDFDTELTAVCRNGNKPQISIYEDPTGSPTTIDFVSVMGTYSDDVQPVHAYVNNDSYGDIIYRNVIIFGANDKYDTNSTNWGGQDNSNYIVADINKDNEFDLIGQDTNFVHLLTMGEAITGTTSSTISLNTNQTFSGIYGTNFFPSGLCLNTQVTFRALQCFGSSFQSDCAYINTQSGVSERIFLQVGTDDNTTGAYDSNNPEVSHTFDEVGEIRARLFFQDSSLPNDLTNYETIYFNVVEAGEPCNTASFTDEFTPSSSILTIEDESDFFNLFSYGNPTYRFIFGLIIIIGMVVMGYSIGQSVFMAIIMGVAGLILATILGLIPIWIIIGMVGLTALPLLLKFAFHRS